MDSLKKALCNLDKVSLSKKVVVAEVSTLTTFWFNDVTNFDKGLWKKGNALHYILINNNIIILLED